MHLKVVFFPSYHTWKIILVFKLKKIHLKVSVSAKTTAIRGICSIGEYLGIGIGGHFGIGAALVNTKRGKSCSITTCFWIELFKVACKYSLYKLNNEHWIQSGSPHSRVLYLKAVDDWIKYKNSILLLFVSVHFFHFSLLYIFHFRTLTHSIEIFYAKKIVCYRMQMCHYSCI